MSSNLDEQSKRVLNESLSVAEELSHHYIGTEHLLLAMCMPFCTLSRTLASQGVTYEKVYNRLSGAKKLSPTVMSIVDMSPALKCIIELSAAQCQGSLITVGNLLRAVITDCENAACRIMKELGANTGLMYSTLTPSSAEKKMRFSANVLKFGVDLTELAAQGKTDPVLCRDKETERVIRILCRRTKNNPCLIGEAGVGKTAIAEGLAKRIADGAVPPQLRDKRIFSLDLPGVVAGAKYRGEFEERFKNLLKELCSSDTIVFIDEIHSIIGAGSAEGSIDAAGILKPILARGGFRLIGATTHAEYIKHIESDSALARRFATVNVEQPTPVQALEILRGLRPKYESFHTLRITDEALQCAIATSVRYIPSRFLPDKAIDLIDEAATLAAVDGGKTVLAAEDVRRAASMQTGIPLESLNMQDRTRLLELESKLKEKIIGQDKAIQTLCPAIRRAWTGYSDENRPIGSFMFCGATGVGKTALACALSDALFDTRDAFIRFDMSEYMEAHSVSRLIGSPPGYIGHEQTGQLVSAIKKHPYSVVLFDEVEKAHSDVLNILLQILDDGALTDAHGMKCSFKNCIVILTTNAGSRSAHTGFLKATSSFDVSKFFSPEFLNRLDGIIPFEPLSRESIAHITRMRLAEALNRRKDISLEFSDETVSFLTDICADSPYGARPVRRAVEQKLLAPLCDSIIQSPSRKVFKAVVKDKEIVIQ